MIKTNTSKRSTNIKEIAYDAAHQAMYITFKSGGIYRYSHVTPLDHAKFLQAKSLGKHFNEFFYERKEHPSQKLSPTSGH